MNRLLIGYGMACLFSLPVQAVECKVDCDCEGLQLDEWRETCAQRQDFIEDYCQQQSVLSYCSLHGESAYPLALRMGINEASPILDSEGIRSAQKKVATLYWAIHTGSGDLKSDIKAGNAESAQKVLSGIEIYLDNLFEVQNQVAKSWADQGQSERVVSAWKDYSEDSYKVAKNLRDLAKQAGKRKLSSVEDQASLIRVQFDLLAAAGYAYEIAGYAYAQANRNKPAARAFRYAARLGMQRIDLAAEHKLRSVDLKYLREQAATRWQRASLYWLREQDLHSAEQGLAHSKEILLR